MKSIKNVRSLKGKRVMVRCDIDVGTDKAGKKILDDTRIVANIPTLQLVLAKGGKLICVAKRRRPKGKRDKTMSLKIVVNELKKHFPKYNVKLVNDFRKSKKVFQTQKKKDILVLENIRYYTDEREEDAGFAQELAALADVFVSDVFACVHRKDTSVFVVPQYLPSYSGLLLDNELRVLSQLVKKPKRPFVVVLGGGKLETKIPVMKNLLTKADRLLVGGALVNTYFKAAGYSVGKSLVSDELGGEALRYIKKKQVTIPIDVVVGDWGGKKTRVVQVRKNPHQLCKRGEAILDIGPETITLFAKHIKEAKTLMWNGAMGYFEQEPYHVGTMSIARLVSSRSKGKAFGVIGGGETLQAMDMAGGMEDIDFVSTGGGAMLTFLAGEELPGMKALST